uniref:MGDG2 n=1 Tax=Arundo donax TaxID=35708 RepID=A0A0A9GU41_ARUDO
MKSFRIIGSPLINASAIVPGPAFVMMQSQAPIHFSICFSNPLILTGTFHLRDCRVDRST